jgi:hypothetical protein
VSSHELVRPNRLLIGTLLLQARRADLIETVRAELDRLRTTAFCLSEDL